MRLWLILITLISALFANPCIAFWEEFNIISGNDGSVKIQAKYRFKGYTVTLRSTTENDKDRYIFLLQRQSFEYVPLEWAGAFFENNNLKRQREGRVFHLYAVSCEEEEWGFIHLGRKKTVATLRDGFWSYYIAEADKALKLWENLKIVKKQETDSVEHFKRVNNRGLARLLPVLDPKIHGVQKQMCIELAFQLVCRFASESRPLLPEKKLDENSEEETVPYQVVAELYGNDPLCKDFADVKFIKHENPSGSKVSGYMDQIFVRAIEEEGEQ